MDLLSTLITPIVESLLVPVKREFGFLVSSSSYVRDMHAKVTAMDGAARDMRDRQVSNKGNGRVVPHRVPGWLAEVDKIKVSVERIPTGLGGCFNMKTKYKAGKQANGIMKEIDRLMNEKDGMVWTNEEKPLGLVSPPRPSTSAVVDVDDQIRNKNNINSRDLIFKDAMESLESSDVKKQKMALCGMGGVGKTTMMEDLKKAATDRKMFDLIVKVTVGQNLNLVTIQQTIAEYSGEALTETTKETRAERLMQRFDAMLRQGKKILVILDDVWEEFNLKDIGVPSPLPSAIKLLLVSREESVCTRMGVETSSIFKIVVLEEPEAKKLFWDTTGLVSFNDIDPDLHQIGEDILKRCGGLPIAINIMASSLRDNMEKEEWKDALFRIRNKEFVALVDIFKFSYNNLKEDDLKATFLLCGLFPEDYDIRIEELMMYAWGLKLFQKVHDISTTRSRVKTHVNKLIRSNLLIKGDSEECVNMHDLVRDFVLSNFSNVKQASIVNNNDNVPEQLREEESYHRILLQCGGMHEFPVDFSHPNLELLKLMDGNKLLKFPEGFYNRMEKLVVVAYQNIHRPLLPQYSINLRALCIRSCSLVGYDISSLGDLIHLEVLSLAYCGVRKLPSKIGKLKRLKLLDLTGCEALCIDDGVFENLKKLEELYLRVYSKTIRFTDDNYEELKKLSKKLSALELEFFENKAQPINVCFEILERFRISVGCLLGKHYVVTSSFKNTLKLVTSIVELLECKINELFKKTEVLHLEMKDMSYLEDILVHPPQMSFCNLKDLLISKCASLTYLFTIPVAKALTKLERLVITSCPLLKSVVSGENSEAIVIAFQQLKILHLIKLPELVSLCDPANAILELPQLVELYLDGLANITSIFPENNIDIPEKQSFLNKKVVISKLEELGINGMENLKEIWPREITWSEEEVNVSMLRMIDVMRCNNLVNLFPLNPMGLLGHLESLTVAECDSIEVLFNIDVGKVDQLGSISPLRRIDARGLKKLREVWRINDVETYYSGHIIHGFQAVETIHISECDKFETVVSPTTANFDMRALKDICIDNSRPYSMIIQDLRQQEEINNMSVDTSIVAFPFYQITHNLHDLRKIKFRGFQVVQTVFEIESSSTRDQSVTSQQPLVLLPNLEELEFWDMNTLTHVWKCSNWNAFLNLHTHPPQSSSLQNLTTITLWKCNSIKYLFSPLMAKLLSNLITIKISFCKDMEEVISSRDDPDEDDETMISSSSHTTTTLFPHLDILDLYIVPNLKHIGGSVAKGTTNVSHGQSEFSQVDVSSWSLCQYLREIKIVRCYALSSIIPSYAAGRLQKLQVLKVEYCSSLVEVFETEEINSNSDGCSSGSPIVQIPRPTNSTLHKLPNLKELEISHCNRLEYIFTFSTLESLKKLESLKIRDCSSMKVIVKEDVREDTTTSSKDRVVFPHLKSIELVRLLNLEGFFLGTDIDFEWPLLDYVMISNCFKMLAFTSGRSTAPKLKHIHTELGKHNLECGLDFHVTPRSHQTPSTSLDDINLDGRTWSFHNLIECNLDPDYHDTKIFPSSELKQLQKLEIIHAKGVLGVEEVFEVAMEATNNESQTVVKFPKLREVNLNDLSSLKYIWRNNRWRTLEFPNLTTLSITCCESLEHVFTCSMVGCVMQLQQLSIESCENMKVIVKEEDEKESDTKAIEVKFPCLKSLKLDYLKSLEGFCLGKDDFSLPSLDTMEIKKCPTITVFTKGRSVTPKLTLVETNFGTVNVGEDINSFIINRKQEGYEFGD